MGRRVLMLLHHPVAATVKWLFSTHQGGGVLKYGANAVQNAVGVESRSVGVESLKTATQQAVSTEVGPYMGAVVPALIISREIHMVCQDVHAAYRQRRDGQITRQEFIKVTIKRVAEGCSSLAGVGAALAIPIAKNSVGCTLAAVIGQGVGVIAGRGLCRLYDRKSVTSTPLP